jgi:hypothetical protein
MAEKIQEIVKDAVADQQMDENDNLRTVESQPLATADSIRDLVQSAMQELCVQMVDDMQKACRTILNEAVGDDSRALASVPTQPSPQSLSQYSDV